MFVHHTSLATTMTDNLPFSVIQYCQMHTIKSTLMLLLVHLLISPLLPATALNCIPCINRPSYTLRAIVHGQTNDPFWTKLASTARQSAQDLRIGLELELYPPNEYSEERMAADIRSVDRETADALIVTIPHALVEEAVREVAGRGMPIFGMNSGFDAVTGEGGLIDEGVVLFFTAMNERLAGEEAARYFLGDYVAAAVEEEGKNGSAAANNDTAVDLSANDTGAVVASNSSTNLFDEQGIINSTSLASNNTVESNRTERRLNEDFGDALFILPSSNADNSAYQQRFEGYRDTLLEATSNANNSSSIQVEWFELDTTSESSIEEALNAKMSNCNYKSVLLASGMYASAVVDSLTSNACQQTKVGTFDTSRDIFDLVSASKLDFAIDQYNHIQGWAPVHFAALYVTTNQALVPPREGGVYLAGPALFTQSNLITDTFKICSDEGFPICPSPDQDDVVVATPSSCPCTNRKEIVIGGVIHGVTTNPFFDTVFAASEQAALDMGITMLFDRIEPQESEELLHRKMSAKILSLCQQGVDGLITSLPSEIVIDAVKVCREFGVPVVTINAGYESSKDLGLEHHVGQVEYRAGFAAGQQLASMASITKAYCINQIPGLNVLTQRCNGFRDALEEVGIPSEEVPVVADNQARYVSIVEEAVNDSGDWDGIGIQILAAFQMEEIRELKEKHPAFSCGAFDLSDQLYDGLDDGTILFTIDQQREFVHTGS